MKPYLYNFEPHFYVVKLEFTRYTLFFLFLLKNIDCDYLLEPLCFEQKYETISEVLSENFQFLVVKFSIYLNRCVFIMKRKVLTF